MNTPEGFAINAMARTIVIITLLITVGTALAEKQFYITTGANLTAFRNQKTYYQPGYTIGLEWQNKGPLQSGLFKGLSWRFGVHYSSIRAILKNKSMGHGLGQNYVAKFYDIHFMTHAIEVPIYLTKNIKLDNKKGFILTAGLKFIMPVVNSTDFDYKKTLNLEGNERNNFSFDYIVNEDKDAGFLSDNGGIAFDLGIGYTYGKISLSLHFLPSLTYQYNTINEYRFNEKPDIICLALNYQITKDE